MNQTYLNPTQSNLNHTGSLSSTNEPIYLYQLIWTQPNLT